MEKEKLILDEFTRKTEEDWLFAAEKSIGKEKLNGFILRIIEYENIPLKPIYTFDNIHLPENIIAALPGQKPYHRGYSGVSNNIYISQIINETDLTRLNKKYRDSINGGMSAIYLYFRNKDILSEEARLSTPNQLDNRNQIDYFESINIDSIESIKKLFQGISLNDVPTIINCESHCLPIASALLAYCIINNYSLSKANFYLYNDPLSLWAKHGSGYSSIDNEINQIYILTRWAFSQNIHIRTIGLKGYIYGNAGGSCVEELGFSVASFVEYIRQLSARGLDISQLDKKTALILSTDSDFFIQIAKYRAARLLLSSIFKNFQLEHQDNYINNEKSHYKEPSFELHTMTTLLNKSKLDPYVNLLRNAGEALSSIIGGTNALIMDSYNSVKGIESEHSLRLARNIALIMNNEAGINDVIDSAGGSWYIEDLTYSLARKAYELFQEVENRGGMKAALIAGFPQQKILNTANKRLKNVYTRKHVLVGTNAYQLKNLISDEVSTYSGYDTLSESGTSTVPSLKISKSSIQSNLNTYSKITINQSRHQNSGIQNSKFSSDSYAKAKEFYRGLLPDIVDVLIEQFKSGASVSEMEKLFDKSKEINIEPIGELRLSDAFEKLVERAYEYKVNNNGLIPKAYICCIAQTEKFRKNLSDIEDIMRIGGFDVVRSNQFNDFHIALEHIIESDIKIIIFYTGNQKELDVISAYSNNIKSRKPDTIVIIASETDEKFQDIVETDVDYLINPSSDIVSLLNYIYDKLEND